MRITVDRSKCLGSGQCMLAAGEVFDQDDTDGLVHLLDNRPPERLAESVREAEQLCPVGAITVDATDN